MKFPARLEPIRSALAHRDFRLFSGGNVASHVGTWVQRMSVGWLAWDLTQSGTWLGIVAFADLFPTVLLAPITGVVAERVERLRALRAVQALNLVQAVLLAGFTLSGAITIEILLILVAVGGTVLAFGQPVRLAIVPSLVARQDLSAAIGINSLIFNGARFVGPMIAGFLILRYGVGWAFAFNAATFVVFLAMLSRIRLEHREQRARARGVRNVPGEIADGYAYAARHKGIGPMLIVLTVVAICARPFMELLPGFADAVFGRGAEGLAWLTSAAGLGAMLGGLWLAQRGAVAGLTATTVSCIALLAAMLIGFSATDIFWLALPCLAVAGFAMIVVGAGEQTLLQNAVDPGLRGRVMGLYGMINRGGPAVGALVMGTLSSYVGLQWPVAGGAAICLLVWLWARSRQEIMTRALEGEDAKGGPSRPRRP